MRVAALFGITIYQKIISPLLKQLLGVRSVCRYSPSCSEYAKMMISKHGLLKGGVMSVKRIISCQPFTGNPKSRL